MLEERQQPLGDILRRSERLILPALGTGLALEHRRVDPVRLGARVADDDRPDPRRALDLGRVATDGLAVLEEDRLLALDVLEAVPDVVRVAVAGDQLERHLLATAADEQRQPGLDRSRLVDDVVRAVVRAGGRRVAPRGACRA